MKYDKMTFMKYTHLLLDLDRTILDFSKAEEKAFKMAIPYATNEDYSLYTKLNDQEWEKLEKGLKTRDEVCVDRYKRFFEITGYNEDAKEINSKYMDLLSLGYDVMDGAIEVLEKVKGKFILVAATNGTAWVQRNRLEKSGVIKYFDYIAISEEIGYQKPSPNYYNSVLNLSKCDNVKKALMVGDSPKADIFGASNVGMDTCWLNQNGENKNYGIESTYEIHQIIDLLKIIGL